MHVKKLKSSAECSLLPDDLDDTLTQKSELLWGRLVTIILSVAHKVLSSVKVTV